MSEKRQPSEKTQSSEQQQPPYEPPSFEEIETETITTAPGGAPNAPPAPS